MVTERHERGQLILITAIAVAFILLAIIIVFNGLLFTQTIASEDASKATEDVMSAEQELGQAVQGMVLRSNLKDSDIDLDNSNNLDRFIETYQHSLKSSRPAIVDSLEVSENSPATLITSSEDEIEDQRNLVDNENEEKEFKIGHFSMTADPDMEDNVAISVSEEGDTITLEIGGDGDCEIDSESVWFDFVQGESTLDRSSCELEIDNENEYRQITIQNATGTQGTDPHTVDYIDYKVVINDEHASEEGSADYRAAWGVDIRYTYHSNDVTATRTFEIENIYDDADHLWPWGAPP